MLRRLHDMPPRARRLAGFIGASFALHLATLVSIPPSGVASAPYRGPLQPEALRATLGPGDRGNAAARAAASEAGAPDAAREAASDPRQLDAQADTREGVPGGADLPFPDKWYTATELDVRAEPLGEVHLDYPDELEGTGIPGRVRLLLFIDERGVVRKMQITTAEPARLFDKAAMHAWTDVRFSPAKKGGVAVKSQKLLELAFRP
jgi:TonB family protein